MAFNFFKKKKKGNMDFEIPSAEEYSKNVNDSENLSIDVYKSIFNKNMVKEIAVCLFNTMHNAHSIIKFYNKRSSNRLKEAVVFWDKDTFPKEVLVAPWKEFIYKGWFVTIFVFHNDDYNDSIDIDIEISAKDDKHRFPIVEVIQGYE